MQTIKQRKELYAGRTEYREADYKFARTCLGFRAPQDKPDWIVPTVSLAIVCVLLLAFWISGGAA